MTRHLKSCKARQEAIAAEQGPKERLFHIRVDCPYAPMYWMHIEIRASAPLVELDRFLRAVWVECCRHLSQFVVDNTYYLSNRTKRTWEPPKEEPEEDKIVPEAITTEEQKVLWDALETLFSDWPEEKGMEVPLEQAVQVGSTFKYEYDMGTPTELRLKVIEEREGVPPLDGVRILARNYAPFIPCEECGERATVIHVWGEEGPIALCDRHAREVPNWPEGFLPVVNSPRVGECAYVGPYHEEYRFEEVAPADLRSTSFAMRNA